VARHSPDPHHCGRSAVRGQNGAVRKARRAFNTEHVHVGALLEQLRAEQPQSELALAVAEAGEGRLSLELLNKVVEFGLQKNACRYRGFVLDGYPRTSEEAALLFLEPPEVKEDAEGEAPAEEEGALEEKPKQLRPTAPLLAVQLTYPDEEAHLTKVQEMFGPEEERTEGFKEGHNDEAGFQRRLQRYNGAPTAVDFYTEYLSADRMLTIDTTGRDSQEVFKAAAEELLRKELPFNYIAPVEFPPPPVEEVGEVEEVKVDEDAIAHARREEEDRARERALMERERELLVKQSTHLRAYLSEVVVPPVIEALMEICHLQPADPVDYLAEYLFHAATAREELGSLPKHWSDLSWGPADDDE